MKIAHLILAHKAPAQLERLLGALSHPQADIFIHLDKKANSQLFTSLALLPNVHFIRCRLDVKWGGYSLTKAAIESMREIIQTSIPYDFINLMSGEDYPIKSLNFIHKFLKQHIGYSFLECQPSTSSWWQANISRVTSYHFTEFSFPGRYALQYLLNRLMPRRKVPGFSTLYGGDMGGWYILSRECANYIVSYLDAHPKLQRFAQFTWGSDEFLVHSILLNSPLASTVINNNLRYTDWSGGGNSPKTLAIEDLLNLSTSSRLFARKFDSNYDNLILDELDRLNR